MSVCPICLVAVARPIFIGAPLKNQRILLELVELEHLDELEADRAPAEVEAPRLADQRRLRRGDGLIGRGGVVGRQEGDAGLGGLLQHRVDGDRVRPLPSRAAATR